MDASKPIGEDLFAPPMHTTTPAGAVTFTHDDDLADINALSLGSNSNSSGSGVDVLGSLSDAAGGASSSSSSLVFGGRPAPGSKLSLSPGSIPQYHISPPQAPPLHPAQPGPQLAYAPTTYSSPTLLNAGASSSKALPPTPDELLHRDMPRPRLSSSPQSFGVQAPAATYDPLTAPSARAHQPMLDPSASPVRGAWPPIGSTGAAAAAAYVHAPPTDMAPPPRPPKTLTVRTTPLTQPGVVLGGPGSVPGNHVPTVIPIPQAPLLSESIHPHQLYFGQAAPGQSAALGGDTDKTPVATGPPAPLPTLTHGAAHALPPPQGYGQPFQATSSGAHGTASAAQSAYVAAPLPGNRTQAHAPLAAEPPSYADSAVSPEALPTFDQASAAAGGGGRFPRWRGWLEKRDLERRYAAMEEAALAAAEGRVARKKSWGAGVHDADALPYDGEGEDEDEDDDDEEYYEDEDEDADGDMSDESGGSGEHVRHDSLSSSSLDPHGSQAKQRTRRSHAGAKLGGLPPPLHTHHFGSRFLPHLPSQPLCAVFLDIPPKPSTPILAVAAAPPPAGPATTTNRLWGGGGGGGGAGAKENTRAPPPRGRARMPQRRTVILVGTAEGLFAVELARPVRRRRRHEQRSQGAHPADNASLSDGEGQGGRTAAATSYTRGWAGGASGGSSLRGSESDAEAGVNRVDREADEADGWNGGIRIVQVWSGLGVFQLSILRSRPPPSAVFGPDGVTLPPSSRGKAGAGHGFMMGGFGGFSPLVGGGASADGPGAGGGGSSGGAIILALTAPGPGPYAPAPPLARISPHSNTLLENSASAAERHHHHFHHHHHSRSSSHANAHEEAFGGAGSGKVAAMNLGPNVAPGCFGVDAGGGPGRAVPTTLSSSSSSSASLHAQMAHNLPGASAGITSSDIGAAAAASATLAGLAAVGGGSGSPNGQVRMWNLEAIRGCVAWALDNQQPCDPLDLNDRNGAGSKKAHKHGKNKLSRAFKKVFAALGDGGSTSSKAAVRPGLSDSVSMDTVETLASARGNRLTKNKDRDAEEKRKRAGQRTASDGSMVSPGWTLIDEQDAKSPTASAIAGRSELDSELGHSGGGLGYEESIRSMGTGTYGRSFDDDRSALSPLSPEADTRSFVEDPAAVAAEASRKAALRLALSSIVIPTGSGGSSTAGTLPGPTIPAALDEDRSGAGASKKGKERPGLDRNGPSSSGSTSGAAGAGSSGIGPVTSSTGSPKPVLFYAVHEAPPGAKGAGTWYLALATTKTVTVYEARPPQRGNSSFLPLSLQRGGAGAAAGQSWNPSGQGMPGAAAGAETRSWSLLRELYTPQAPKAIAFAQASTTDIPLSAKEKGAGLHPDSVLKPQFAGGLAGPRAWMGADLSLLVTFGHRAVIIRLTDLNVRDFDLSPTNWNPQLEVRHPGFPSETTPSASGEESGALNPESHGSLPVRGPGSATHHRRASSTSLHNNDEKQNWAGMHLVDVKIILKQSHRCSDRTDATGGVPMATSRSAGPTLTPSGESQGVGAGTRTVQTPAVFTSVLTPNAAPAFRPFDDPNAPSHPSSVTPVRVASTTSSSGADTESTTTNDEDEDDSLADGIGGDEDQSEIVYTTTGRQAVALRDRSVHLSSGSRSDPTLSIVDRSGPSVAREPTSSSGKRQGAQQQQAAPQRRSRDRERADKKYAEAGSAGGKLVSTSFVLLTRGPSTQILPLPLPADLCKPKPLDVLNWSGVPNAISAWARVVGLERERTTGAMSTADIGSRSGGSARRGPSTEDQATTSSIILHMNVTVLAFMASKVESQRKRIRMYVPLSFPLLRDAEIELLPMLDALLPMPIPTPVSVHRPKHGAAGPNAAGEPVAADGAASHAVQIRLKTNPRAYALGVSRANDLCICADPPRVGSHASTFDAARRRSLAEPVARREQEFEYLSGMLVGVPHRGGVRPASIAALDVCRPWEMRGDGGVLAWDWRGGRDYRLFFVGAEV